MKSNIDHARALIEKAEHDLKAAEIGLEHYPEKEEVEKALSTALALRDALVPLIEPTT